MGAVLVAALAVTGCRAGHPVAAGPTGARPPASSTPTPSPSFDPDNPPVVDTTVSMQDFGERPNGGEDGVFLVGARYVVRPDGSHTRTTVVTRRSDGRVVLRYTPARPAFETDFAGLDGDMLVLTDEDTVDEEPGKLPATATIFNLVTGTRTPVARVPGAPPLSLYGPQATVTEGRFYYSASVHGGFSNCVGEIDLTHLTGQVVTCGKSGEWILYVKSAEHGAAWVHFHGHSFDVCRDGELIQGGVTGPDGPADDCGTFDVSALDGWQVWESFPPGGVVPGGALAATDGTRVVQLGEEANGTLVACAGYVYWDPASDGKQLVRWRPDGPIERVYQVTGDVENTWVYGVACADGILTVRIDRYSITTGNFTAQLMAVGGSAA